MPITPTVIIIDGSKSSVSANPAIALSTNWIPNTEWIIANTKGRAKNIPI